MKKPCRLVADRAKPARWLAGGKVIDEGFEIAGERRFLCSPDPGRRLRLLQSACRFDSFGCHINTDGDCWTLRVALMARRRQAIHVRIAAGHSVRLRLSASLQAGPADGLRLQIDFTYRVTYPRHGSARAGLPWVCHSTGMVVQPALRRLPHLRLHPARMSGCGRKNRTFVAAAYETAQPTNRLPAKFWSIESLLIGLFVESLSEI